MRDIQLIRILSEIISKTTDYHDCLRLVVESLAKQLNVDLCNIYVFDDKEECLILEATYGLAQRNVHSLKLRSGQGLSGVCYATKSLLNLADMHASEHFLSLSQTRFEQYHALMCVPLLIGGRIIGVLSMARRKIGEFSSETTELIEALVVPLAIFILNAGLSDQLSEGIRDRKSRPKAEDTLRGTSISDGVVHGMAYFVAGAEALEAEPLVYSTDFEAEMQLLDQALTVAREDSTELQKEAAVLLAEADAAIFYAHILLLDDPTLIRRIHDALKHGYKLRPALKIVINEIQEELRMLDNIILRERIADMKDVIFRIYQAIDEIQGQSQKPQRLRSLKGHKRPIIVTRELLPSQLIRLPLASLGGIICEMGGSTTHVAILARTLHIPMLIGASGATQKIDHNDELILDCTAGLCYIHPTPDLLKQFRPALKFHRQPDNEVVSPKTPTTTQDGTLVRLGSNISLINELPLLDRYGACGVGLYRPEFMFMIRNSFPSENEQVSVFKRIVEACPDSSVTIRVLDIGGDKPLPYVDFGHEENPALGWRGLRFLLSNPQYLEPHLRALLRSTAFGNMNLLLPMVANLDELLELKAVLRKVEVQLREEGIAYDEGYHLGIMLEVPSAIFALPDMLPHIDFVSIGTNDLTQYLFAVDRGNSRVSQWFRQFHPVLLKIIKQTCDMVGAFEDKTVSLCGEMAGNPGGTPLLLGAGIRYLSMNPWRIPGVRDTLGKVTMSECEELFQNALSCTLDKQVATLMQDFAMAHDLQTRRKS
jgi:phosphotransferase system enzyme I (PtsP)